jgi:hypothetical protein
MNRTAIALVALLCLTAFAPAPFPKTQRAGREQDEITVQTFEGTWRVAGMMRLRSDGKHTPHNWRATQIRVENGLWSFMQDDHAYASYAIAIRHASKPASLDFYNKVNRDQPALGQGIIRRKGDVVEIIYVFGRQQRAVSFDQPPDGQYLLTLKRKR